VAPREYCEGAAKWFFDRDGSFLDVQDFADVWFIGDEPVEGEDRIAYLRHREQYMKYVVDKLGCNEGSAMEAAKQIYAFKRRGGASEARK